MSKVKIPAAALLLVASIGLAPLTASAPLSASAAATTNTSKAKTEITNSTNSIRVQSMNVKLIFDGVNIQPPASQYVFMYNNTTYVPVRFMSNALQKSVTWDAKNLKVTLAEPSSSELVVLKEYLMNAANVKNSSTAAKSLILDKVKASYVFNGSLKPVPAGQSSYMLNESLYVPLRFLSESVGNNISWDQKTKTITAVSAGYKDQMNSNTSSNNGTTLSATTTPGATEGAGAAGGSSAGAEAGKVSYETITSETEAKLNALKSQSQSTLMSIAFEYLAAEDDASKSTIKAKGIQQLASFTSSFNSIVADAEEKLSKNGYSTAIISQYRDEFESQLQLGKDLAEGMAD